MLSQKDFLEKLRLPDLPISHLPTYFFGHSKLRRAPYKNKSYTIEQLKDTLRQETQDVNADTLRPLFQNL